MFENRVLRRVFGHKRDEVTGEWRRLHVEEIYDQYSSPNIVGSNPTGGMDVCLLWVLCVVR